MRREILTVMPIFPVQRYTITLMGLLFVSCATTQPPPEEREAYGWAPV